LLRPALNSNELTQKAVQYYSLAPSTKEKKEPTYTCNLGHGENYGDKRRRRGRAYIYSEEVSGKGSEVTGEYRRRQQNCVTPCEAVPGIPQLEKSQLNKKTDPPGSGQFFKCSSRIRT
jgi:hypothetical protein